jgi:hypothetical protein
MDILGYRLSYHHRLLGRKNMGKVDNADIRRSLADWLG